MRTIKKEDYFNRFLELCNECKTYKQAYEQTEREFYEKFGDNKYSDYNAFKQAKRRFINANLRKKFAAKSARRKEAEKEA